LYVSVNGGGLKQPLPPLLLLLLLVPPLMGLEGAGTATKLLIVVAASSSGGCCRKHRCSNDNDINLRVARDGRHGFVVILYTYNSLENRDAIHGRNILDLFNVVLIELATSSSSYSAGTPESSEL